MNRRWFLKVFATGVAATVVLTKLPVHWIPEQVRQRTVCAYLTKLYNAQVKGTASRYHPKNIYVSQALYDGYSSEIQCFERFTTIEDLRQGVPSLVFKCTRMTVDPRLKGWEVSFV